MSMIPTAQSIKGRQRATSLLSEPSSMEPGVHQMDVVLYIVLTTGV